MVVALFMGWTEDQWAFAKTVSGLDVATTAGCLTVRNWWRRHRTDEPSIDQVIIGVERPKPDYMWVCELLANATMIPERASA